MKITTINPANGEVINHYSTYSDSELDKILAGGYKAYLNWQLFDLNSKTELLLNLAKLLDENKNIYAQLISTEMGKPIAQARAEIDKCAWACKHYAEHASNYLTARVVTTEHSKSYVCYKPLGVIFGIMPWNFPFWQVFRFAVPTILAGNTVLVKHADNCTGISMVLEQLFLEAGFDKHVFSSIIADHTQAEKIIKDVRIAALTITGSERAGRKVASIAASSLKKSVLELGGNDPYIILADADLQLAAEQAINSRLNNTGQVCIAAKRIIVVKEIAEEFKKIVLAKINNFKIGDPLDESVNLGPLARDDLRKTLHKQVEESIELGAECLFGGKIDESSSGFYYPITVLDKVTANMPAYHEELFGPVVCFIEAQDEKEAIEIANDSHYGLSAAVFSNNINKAEDIAQNKLNFGTVAVNKMVASDPRLPFGGIKSSGYGRELGIEGIHEFVNIKTIIIN